MIGGRNFQNRILFQHVARVGGFEAARRFFGGLDLSVVRRHVRALEEELGLVLYQRRTFQLTRAGRILYEFDRPLLEKMSGASAHVHRKISPRLTAGVTGSAAKNFLFPMVRTWLDDPARDPIECRFGSLHALRPELETGELDLLITAIAGAPPEGFASHTLATFPLVLIVPENCPLKSAAELWAKGRPTGHLIAPEADDPVTLAFGRGLARGGLTWPTRLTCDSPASVGQMVAGGLGYGLSLAAIACGSPQPKAPLRMTGSGLRGSSIPSAISDLPSSGPRPGIRELPLPGFDPVPIVVLWRPKDSTRLKEPLKLIRGSETLAPSSVTGR